MEISKKDQKSLSKIITSLKKYQRAELKDVNKDLIDVLYTDLLPNEYIFDKSKLINTTFLIGRKGTGKSTIFQKLEKYYRDSQNCLPAYLDVQTVFDSSQSDYLKQWKKSEKFSIDAFEKYLIERQFLLSVLREVQKEISKRFDTFWGKITNVLQKKKLAKVKEELEKLVENLDNNSCLSQIEINTLKEISVRKTRAANSLDQSHEEYHISNPSVNFNPSGVSIKSGVEVTDQRVMRIGGAKAIDESYSTMFLQVFQISKYTDVIQNTLSMVGIDNLIILLDDFSEISDSALTTFVDVILAPLNNWSKGFIKFKVAAYPNKVYYGKLDLTKIDVINLDYYNLYSQFDRVQMEDYAKDFTKRLIEKRFKHYGDLNPRVVFNCSSVNLEDYYELLFFVSMNVPRVLGWILSICHDNRVAFGRQINKSDIEAAAQKYYERYVSSFFTTSTISLVSFDEKISTLQMKELLDKITDELILESKKIQNGERKGSVYIQRQPYCSHFYFTPQYEDFIKTLELNFFLSKYDAMVDKDGKEVSIYCVNYGLAKKYKLLWGKPKGSGYTKYFTQRAFDFNKVIYSYFNSAKIIQCTNNLCNAQFPLDNLDVFKLTKNKCPECHHSVEIKSTSKELKKKISSIKDANLLPQIEVKILKELELSNSFVFARELAEAIDMSSRQIAFKCKRLMSAFNYIERYKEVDYQPYKYKITEKGRQYFNQT